MVDVNVLVSAVVRPGSPGSFAAWPSPPPESPNAAADCIGIFNDGREFALWLSPHILACVADVLLEDYRWNESRVRTYTRILREIANTSGGGVLDPESEIGDCPDYEDNRILELALDSGAMLIVSDDAHLSQMSPWRGMPIVSSREFRDRVATARRLQTRRGR